MYYFGNLFWKAGWPNFSFYALEEMRIPNFQNCNVIFYYRHINSIEEKLGIPPLERVDVDSIK